MIKRYEISQKSRRHVTPKGDQDQSQTLTLEYKTQKSHIKSNPISKQGTTTQKYKLKDFEKFEEDENELSRTINN